MARISHFGIPSSLLSEEVDGGRLKNWEFPKELESGVESVGLVGL